MKYLLKIMSLFLILTSCQKELTAKEIINKVQDKVKKSKYGHYKQTEVVKKVSIGEDSTITKKQLDFYYKFEPKDTLIGFKIASLEKDGFHHVYNTKNLFGITTWDKTLTITNKNRHPERVAKIKQSYNSFPFFYFVKNIFDSVEKDNKVEIVNLGSVKIDDQDCYMLKVINPKNNQQITSESTYYISKDQFLPIGLDIFISTTIGNAKEVMSFETRISHINLEDQISDEIFTQEKLSEHIKVINYTPRQDQNSNTLLSVGEKAPLWTLTNSKGTKINLDDFKGKITIMDFWYKACGPCNKQMVKLQELHNKYSEEKVKFIGINTIDNPIKDNIDLFLKKRNVTMENVFNGKTIEKDYQVMASPALFVIDQNGIIVHNIDGYSQNIVSELTEVIEKHLK